MRVHLIDGTYELLRRYYGAPKRKSASTGREIAATRSLARSLLSLIESGVTHIAAAYDTVIESFRNELYAGYKTGAGIEEPLADQFELAERATRALGVTCWSMIEFEADDAIATAARRCLADPAVEQVVICSPDKDLHQCVAGERVVIWDQLRDTVRDEAAVIDKFGVPPVAIPDYLALIGDAADGFPGLPGWGARSTAAVLAAHGTIEAIPDDPGAWKVKVRGAARLAETLRERREEALLYKRLATLRLDVPLAESVADLAWRGPRAGDIEDIARELDDPGLAARAAKLSGGGA